MRCGIYALWVDQLYLLQGHGMGLVLPVHDTR